MTFNLWIKEKADALGVTRKQIARLSGVSERRLVSSYTRPPRIENLVIICEIINELQKGDRASFDSLILEALETITIEYQYAIQRMEK
jgi:hypothetical protein